MSDTQTDAPQISSLAAPTEADMAKLRAMSAEERRELLAVLSGETVLAARKRPALTSFHDQEPVSLFQDIAGNHPACRYDVCPISAFITQCRRPAP